MNWFYADNGQQRGPIPEEEFNSLVAAGTIQATTLVWCEGMAGWKPLSEVRPVVAEPAGAVTGISNDGGGTAAAPVVGAVVCSVCGKSFSEEQIIRFGPTIVCGGCKPVFLQRLREGASTASGEGSGSLSTAEILARDYESDIGGDLGRSWEAFKADVGVTIGATVLVYLCLMAGGVVPIIGPIFQLVCSGALMGGLWYFYIRRARAETASIGDAFSGFGPKFLQLFLVQLIPSLILGGVMVLVVVGIFAIGVPTGAIGARSNSPAVPGIGLALLIGVGLVVALAMAFLQVCWLFAIPLVIDKGLGFWPALELSRKVVMKRFWSTLLLVILFGLLSFAGILACGLGALVTGPWAFGALAQHYNRVFGQLRQGG